MLAITGVLSRAFKSPELASERIKTLSSAVSFKRQFIKSDLEGLELLNALPDLAKQGKLLDEKGVPELNLDKFLGSKEAISGLDQLLKQKDEIERVLKKVKDAERLTGTAQGLLTVRRGIVESDPQLRAAKDKRIATERLLLQTENEFGSDTLRADKFVADAERVSRDTGAGELRILFDKGVAAGTRFVLGDKTFLKLPGVDAALSRPISQDQADFTKRQIQELGLDPASPLLTSDPARRPRNRGLPIEFSRLPGSADIDAPEGVGALEATKNYLDLVSKYRDAVRVDKPNPATDAAVEFFGVPLKTTPLPGERPADGAPVSFDPHLESSPASAAAGPVSAARDLKRLFTMVSTAADAITELFGASPETVESPGKRPVIGAVPVLFAQTLEASAADIPATRSPQRAAQSLGTLGNAEAESITELIGVPPKTARLPAVPPLGAAAPFFDPHLESSTGGAASGAGDQVRELLRGSPQRPAALDNRVGVPAAELPGLPVPVSSPVVAADGQTGEMLRVMKEIRDNTAKTPVLAGVPAVIGGDVPDDSGFTEVLHVMQEIRDNTAKAAARSSGGTLGRGPDEDR